MKQPGQIHRRRLYGRGTGRALSDRQRQLLGTLGARLALPGGEDGGPIDPADVFPNASCHALEIGFGAGEHLAGQAVARPDLGIVGVEFFTEGFAKALARLADVGVAADRVRVHKGDGRAVADRFTDASLDFVYVLFPDPWPKLRHHKRRLIQFDTLDVFARVLRSGGCLRIATDVQSYVDWALWHTRAHGQFVWTAQGARDWTVPPVDHVTTRYESKNMGDCPPVFLDFRRR